MRYRTLTLWLLPATAALPAVAQDELVARRYADEFSAVVADAATNRPLPGVTIINRRLSQYVHSDSSGWFSIAAAGNDLLLIQHTRYLTSNVLVRGKGRKDTIFLQPKVYPVERLTNIDAYRKDSIETRIVYRKAIADAERKVKWIIIPPFFIQADGLFSDIAQRISGQKKRDRSLLRAITNGEQEHYVALRYNPETVKQVLPLSDSLASDFVTRNPMSYTFALGASDLDICRWIRDRSQTAGR